MAQLNMKIEKHISLKCYKLIIRHALAQLLSFKEKYIIL